ncbi:hypothetical protein [Kocuria kalidii]|uniref:hypothetical protein n=1 Tax=Kocuria kalidii TaxID=3376283 RepID=UPI0037B92C3E
MEISTTSTDDLKQHLTEIAVEQGYRRNTGIRGDNEYLAAMNDETLRDHQLYIVREIARREAGPRYFATIK